MNIHDLFSDEQVNPESAVGWYLSRMKASGITEAVASKCGLSLEFSDDNTYINIPYFTVEGIETTFRRQRNREQQYVQEAGQSSGNFLGKYTQKKGSKNRVYWPPLCSQRIFYNDPTCPMLVCEGEFKSIAGFMAMAASGIPMLVAGVPGTKLSESVLDDLRGICCMSGTTRRTVYIAADWNGRGKSREASAALEYDLKKLFQTLGAHVIMLRWPCDSGKEQKLDDWLVAGGDLSQAIRLSTEQDKAIDTEMSLLWDYFNSNYAICHGNYIPLSNPAQKYSVSNFLVMEASKSLQVSAKKILNASQVWGLQRQQDRNIIDGYTFSPSPLGVTPERYVWEEGKRKLNTAPPSVELGNPMDARVTDDDVAPFVGLLKRLAQDNWVWLANYLAHTAQHPSVRGYHIVILHDSGGTGKSSLFDTMDAVFGPYSGPVGSSMTTSYNAGLEGKVLLHWSDPVIHGAVDKFLDSALKNFSGDKMLEVNHKFGNKYHVRNYGRLFIATNKDWIVPISSEERRYVVLGGKEKMPPSEWQEYDSWLRSGGVVKIRDWLVERDLSEFSISAPGPRTDQRSEMEAASAHPFLQMFDNEILSVKDIWTTSELCALYKDRLTENAASRLMKAHKLLDGRPTLVDGKTKRLRCIRNSQRWEQASAVEWAQEYKRHDA